MARKGGEKGRPDGAADQRPDLAHERVDPGPDYVAEDEEQQQPGTDASL